MSLSVTNLISTAQSKITSIKASGWYHSFYTPPVSAGYDATLDADTTTVINNLTTIGANALTYCNALTSGSTNIIIAGSVTIPTLDTTTIFDNWILGIKAISDGLYINYINTNLDWLLASQRSLTEIKNTMGTMEISGSPWIGGGLAYYTNNKKTRLTTLYNDLLNFPSYLQSTMSLLAVQSVAQGNESIRNNLTLLHNTLSTTNVDADIATSTLNTAIAAGGTNSAILLAANTAALSSSGKGTLITNLGNSIITDTALLTGLT